MIHIFRCQPLYYSHHHNHQQALSFGGKPLRQREEKEDGKQDAQENERIEEEYIQNKLAAKIHFRFVELQVKTCGLSASSRATRREIKKNVGKNGQRKGTRFRKRCPKHRKQFPRLFIVVIFQQRTESHEMFILLPLLGALQCTTVTV